VEVVLPLLAYVGVLTGILWAVARKGVNAPLEPNPPRERVKRVYTLGDQVLARVAEQHGLKHDVDVASGRVGELRVEIAATPDGTSPMTFDAVARFPRSLGLELSVKQRGSFGGRSGEAVVSDDFDHDFKVDALHADQARELLGAAVGEALRKGVSRGFRVELDDRELVLSVSANLGTERAVEAMSWLVQTAQAILEARARLARPALEQRVLDAFGSLARSLGGSVDGDVLRLDLEEGELSAHVDRVSGKRFRTELCLTFAKPLTLDLRLGLESERSRFARFRHKDIQLGQPSFDEVFVVMGEPEEEVKAALDEPLRAELLALHQNVDALSLTPTEIEVAVDEALADRDALGDLVEAMTGVAQRLAPRKKQRAYR
jgi:hypothetical protein